MTAVTEHTPGPWFTHPHPAGCVRITTDNPNTTIAETGCWLPKFLPEMRANARLIAAAPAMLAALKLVWASIDRVNHPAAEAVRAAIKLAEEG